MQPVKGSLPTIASLPYNETFYDGLIQKGVVERSQLDFITKEELSRLQLFYQVALFKGQITTASFKILNVREDYRLYSLIQFFKTGQFLPPLLQNPYTSPGIHRDLSEMISTAIPSILKNLYQVHPVPFLAFTLSQQQKMFFCLFAAIDGTLSPSLVSFAWAYDNKDDDCHKWDWPIREMILDTAQNRLNRICEILEKSPQTKERLCSLFDSLHFKTLSEFDAMEKILEILGPCLSQLPVLVDFKEMKSLKNEVDLLLATRKKAQEVFVQRRDKDMYYQKAFQMIIQCTEYYQLVHKKILTKEEFDLFKQKTSQFRAEIEKFNQAITERAAQRNPGPSGPG